MLCTYVYWARHHSPSTSWGCVSCQTQSNTLLAMLPMDCIPMLLSGVLASFVLYTLSPQLSGLPGLRARVQPPFLFLGCRHLRACTSRSSGKGSSLASEGHSSYSCGPRAVWHSCCCLLRYDPATSILASDTSQRCSLSCCCVLTVLLSRNLHRCCCHRAAPESSADGEAGICAAKLLLFRLAVWPCNVSFDPWSRHRKHQVVAAIEARQHLLVSWRQIMAKSG